MPIYLKIAGLNGDSTNPKFKGWFEVDEFDFGATRPTSPNGTGPASFSPLTVDIHSLTGLAPLLSDLATDKVLKTVELVDVATNKKGQAQTVYDIKLTNAVLNKISFAPGAKETETGLSFDFQKVSLTDQGVTGKESTSASALHFTAVGAAAPDTMTPVPPKSAEHYFLKVAGLTGNSTDPNHKGWFEVDGFDFGATRPTSATGQGIGRVAFTPLTVDLSSLTGLAPLLGDLTAHKDLKTVELIGVTGNDHKVYDLTLTNATLDTYSNTPGAKGVETGLSFGFERVSLTDHGVTSKGVLGAPESTDAVAQSFTASPAVASEAPVPAKSPEHYFLKVAGLTGNSTDPNHKGWFEVDGFDFGATRPTSATGQGLGRVMFTPLTVDLSSLTGLAPLLGDLTTHKDLKTVELIGVTGNDHKVYDLTLTNATLDTYSNTPGAKGVETGLSFGFERVTLTDHGVTSKGVLGAPESTDAVAQSFTASPAAASETPVPAKSPEHYFLKVAGLTGNSTDPNHKGWFEVDGFDFGATRPTSATGQGIGRVAFTPLTVDLSSLTGLAPLLGDLTAHKDLKTVELIGVTGNDHKVYDLTLTNATLDTYSNTPGAKGVETGLSFGFERVSLTDHGVTSKGVLGAPESTDAVAQSFTASPAVASEAPVPAKSPEHYFLKVAGLTGNSTDPNHKGWFEVDGFDFGATRPTSATGQGLGRVMFTPLTVDLSSLTGLAPLLGDLTTHKDLKTVELIGVTGNDHKVYDLTLTNATLDTYSNTPGAKGVETGLSFGFERVTLTDHGVTSKGVLGAPESTDAVAQSFTASPAAASETPVPAKSPEHYFLKVAGLTGNSTDPNHRGWFKVDGFDFGATRPTNVAGQATGRVAFSPLTVDINSVAGQAPLLADLATNQNLKTVELVGVIGSDRTVYDLTLTNAMLVMMQSAAGFPGVETSLAFNFQKGTLTDHGVTSEGTLTAPQSVSFNSHSSVG